VVKLRRYGRHNRLNFSVISLVATLATFSAMQEALAESAVASFQGDQRATQEASAAESDYNGEDFTRPESKVTIRLEGKTSGSTTKSERVTLFLQGEVAYTLESNWWVDWLVRLPVVSKSTTVEDPVSSTHEFGLGDAEVQVIAARPITERWAAGLGLGIIAPSAEGTIGNGKWQVLPGVGTRYLFPERGSNTYFVPKLRYAMSVGGDRSERNISELQIAPTMSIGLPNRWFVLLYPSFDIRINFGDRISGQVGRLFLPIDAAVGRKLSDNFVMTLEVSVPVVKDFPVYELKAELKVSAAF
jgi:hypothetical protein